jgi:hypothetical protein
VTGLAHEEFARILAEIAAATSPEKARAILAAASMAGEQLGAIDEFQFAALCDVIREKGGAS